MKKSKTYKIDPERWLEIIQKRKNAEFAWEFFRRPMTSTEVKKETHSHLYMISEAFRVWKEKHCLNEHTFYSKRLAKGKESKYDYPMKKYELNLVPLFEYAKNEKKSFTDMEKRILTWLFWHPSVREKTYQKYHKKDNVILGILKFYFSNYFRIYAIPKTYDWESLIKEKKEVKKKSFPTFLYKFEDLRKQVISFPNEEELENPYPDQYEKVIPIKDIEVVKSNSIKVDFSYSSKEMAEDRVKQSIETNVWNFYFYYEKFHNELPQEMVNLDRKIMDLLGLI